MSYTEIFKINKKGEGEFVDETNNAWRGAMAIWGKLEEKYLPSLPRPDWSYIMNKGEGKEDEYKNRYWSRTSIPSFNKEERNPMQDVWDLGNDEKLPVNERIVMCTTFDNVLVKKENLQKVIDAFETFEFETSLPEQATILKELLNDDDCLAVGWNQTSVVSDSWSTTGKEVYNEEYEEMVEGPYNINEQDTHWFLFEEKEHLV